MSIIKSKAAAYFFLTVTTSVWGSQYVVSKFVLGHIPTFTVLFSRFLLAGVLLMLVVIKKKPKKIERKDYKYILFIGIGGYFLGIGSQLIATKLSNASISSLINSINPIFIIIFAVIFLKEKITFSKVVSVAAALAGVYIIIGGAGKGGTLIGIIFSIFSVLAWSLMSVMVRRVTQKYDPLTITAYGISIAALFTMPLSVFEIATTRNIVFDVPSIISLLYMGLISTTLAHVLWNKSLSMIEAGNCALFYPLQPMVSTLMGILFLSEKITSSFIIGAILIIAGVMFSVVAGKRPTNPKST